MVRSPRVCVCQDFFLVQLKYVLLAGTAYKDSTIVVEQHPVRNNSKKLKYSNLHCYLLRLF